MQWQKSLSEIIDGLNKLVAKGFDKETFPYNFAQVFETSKATITNLKNGSTNASDYSKEGGVLVPRSFHYLPAKDGDLEKAIHLLEHSKKNKAKKTRPQILITTDGKSVLAKDMLAEEFKTQEKLSCPFADLAKHYVFFRPLAGMDRVSVLIKEQANKEASLVLKELHDELVARNPEWGDGGSYQHLMNRFIIRLIFCLFSQDVGIFPSDQFRKVVLNNTRQDGKEADDVIKLAFEAMNLKPGSPKRKQLPAWTHELKYVNGGLFEGTIDVPEFTPKAFVRLRDTWEMDWKSINPDIFGSMIQNIAQKGDRSKLGIHYTSPENIMKCLKPLFLDDLDAEIRRCRGKRDEKKKLRTILERLNKTHIFDPACGSGNFLVMAYQQLRKRETIILRRLTKLGDRLNVREMFSHINILNFHGIEITDLGQETAKLSLFIARYQANKRFSDEFGIPYNPLPLDKSEEPNIHPDNALHIKWEDVCEPKKDRQVYIVGNPPFLGRRGQDDKQKADKEFVLGKDIRSYKSLDYVACWYYLASSYIHNKHASCALVSTNSLCQGENINILWSWIFKEDIEISFAHESFKWQNDARNSAGVTCIIVGLRNIQKAPKYLFSEKGKQKVSNINAYLLDAPNAAVQKSRKNMFGLPVMLYGNMPADGGGLIFSVNEKDNLLTSSPEMEIYIRRLMGGQDFSHDNTVIVYG